MGLPPILHSIGALTPPTPITQPVIQNHAKFGLNQSSQRASYLQNKPLFGSSSPVDIPVGSPNIMHAGLPYL